MKGILVQFEVEMLCMGDDKKEKGSVLFFKGMISPTTKGIIRHSKSIFF